MQGHLITVDGATHPLTIDSVQELLASNTRFWVDLAAPTEEEVHALLGDTFAFHPLAVEDAVHFGQRPKVDAYDAFTLLVVYGVTADAHLVEVHCFYSAQYLLTVHRDACPALAELAQRWRQHAGKNDHVMLLYRVVDTLVDGYFPVLERFDDAIDELEDEILQRPTDAQLGRLFDLKRALIGVRKVVTPQRDLMASLLAGRDTIPDMTDDAERYFRDLYDHLIRISDLVDSYRDLLSGAMDTHLSTVSNRLNVVMKQLTIIATIFLPMSFLTGFFGQNFGWMVNRLGGLAVFAGGGLGLQVVVAVALLYLFRRRGWISSDGTVPSPTAAARPAVPRAKRWHLLDPQRGSR